MVRLLILIAAALIAPASPVLAEIVDGDRITIIDGDTVALPCVRRAPGCAEKLRLLDIDAPETFRPRCERELELGLHAKARLASLLRRKKVEVVRSGRRDRYRRTLGRLRTPTGDVGELLRREGLALLYQPGADEKAARLRYWCG